VSRHLWISALIVILLGGAALRVVWLRSDPPTSASVGVVWHDEGAWTSNARNKALWGVWRTDEWNPVFVAPVFTALEYGAFESFGVGLWQARTVSVAAGLIAIVFLMAGLASAANRRSAVIAGVLLATDYGFVMWNRAALMESTMTAGIVVAWACYAIAHTRPRWGALAGAAAVAAYFTKASAAFFLAALVLDACATIALAHAPALRARLRARTPDIPEVRGALWTIAGLAVAGGLIGLAFVAPHAREYFFYNVQMSIERKPSYALSALVTRASWLPFVQSFFTRSIAEFAAAMLGVLAIAARWRTARPAERLLVLWVLVGLLELVVHDSGNERRYVMFFPAFAALAALAARRDRPLLPATLTGVRWPGRLAAAVLALGLGYLVAGSAYHAVFQADIAANQLRTIARVSALTSLVCTAGLLIAWPRVTALLTASAPTGVVIALLIATSGWNLTTFASWARHRTTMNDDASIAIGRKLPPGTLVQGIFASGLSLENRIRPLFIGNGFGNYADRLDRPDVRYILTEIVPAIGYESQKGSGLIQGILDRTPGWRPVGAYDVTAFDGRDATDRAVLIDKFPDEPHARD
jgi:4-amino-4-deoxy-L-arabinose transferase-like glycosyltransferase